MTAPLPALDGRRIPSLDGLRALAILLVIAGHIASSLPPGAVDAMAPLFTFIGQSGRGVSLFFVISGFLITRLLLKEQERTGRISLRGFMARRALRILPAFYFYLAVLGLLALAGALVLPAQSLIAAATFTWNYWRVEGSWWVGHVWTLCIEEQFYLTWPLLLVLLGRSRAAWLALAVILAEPVVRVASYFLAPGQRPVLSIMLHTRADMLMFGCLAALCYDQPRFQSLLNRIFRTRLQWLLISLSFIGGPLLEARFAAGYLFTVGYTLDGVAIALGMLWLIQHAGSPLGRFFNSRLMVGIGVLSYSLYLWQQLFLTGENHTLLGRVPVSIVASFAAAWLSYRLVEQPFLTLKGRFAVRPSPTPSPT